MKRDLQRRPASGVAELSASPKIVCSLAFRQALKLLGTVTAKRQHYAHEDSNQEF
jgi:hypothetical protein